MAYHKISEVQKYRTAVAVSSQTRQFNIRYKMADILILCEYDLSDEAQALLVSAYESIEDYIRFDRIFGSTLRPHRTLKPPASDIVAKMAEASEKFDVGPMAAVAGAIAQHIGKNLGTDFVIVENGGDIYARVEEELKVRIYCGKESPFKDSVTIAVDASGGIGICTSAKQGRSLSFGCADAFCVICDDSAYADAAATAFANQVKSPADVPLIVKKALKHPLVKGVVGVASDVLCTGGRLRLLTC
jgi:ApbE superfamily uncharacterized protein (UPF0280 family)